MIRTSCLSGKITCSVDLYWVLEAIDFQPLILFRYLEKSKNGKEENNDDNIGKLFLSMVFPMLTFLPPSGGAV